MNIFCFINPLREYNMSLGLTQDIKRRKSLGSFPVIRYIDGNKTGGVMSPLNVLSTQQTAEKKRCSKQAILDIITRLLYHASHREDSPVTQDHNFIHPVTGDKREQTY